MRRQSFCDGTTSACSTHSTNAVAKRRARCGTASGSIALAAEFNAERDLRAFEACEAALRERFGEAENVWADTQAQLLHRLPFGIGGETTVWVDGPDGVVDAREVSDLIAKLSGKAYWRKLFVRRPAVDVGEARRICASTNRFVILSVDRERCVVEAERSIASELAEWTNAVLRALSAVRRLRLAPPPDARSGRETANRRRSRGLSCSQKATLLGSPPCSPQIPILKPCVRRGRVRRPAS